MPDTEADVSKAILAVFPDGQKASIPTMTYGEYLNKLNVRAQSQNTVWQGTHTVSKRKLEIKQKLDRHELFILIEQQKQILQVRCDLWDGTEEKELGTITITAIAEY